MLQFMVGHCCRLLVTVQAVHLRQWKAFAVRAPRDKQIALSPKSVTTRSHQPARQSGE
jgi:hypothetical protein